MAGLIRIGAFELDTGGRRLLIAGRPAVLGGRAFDLLRVLVACAERPVPKDELLDAVWPGRDVEEGNLAVQISALRKLLGPQAIATVPGRGYRFTLGWDGAAAQAPRTEPADAALPRPEHRLPPLPGALLGRDADLWRLRIELSAARLVNVVGAGGIGKTRLALAAAHAEAGRFPDGAAWVDLSDLSGRNGSSPAPDAATLALRIGVGTGVQNDRAPDPAAALVQGLRPRRMLVVLDNCEHLAAPLAALLAAALAAAPGVLWLATSQEPLKLPAERVLRLGMLALPQHGMALPEALACGALALLVQRAYAADRRFALDDAALPAAIDICQRLDGVPLALELAAARLPKLGAQALRDRLHDQLQLLRGDGRGAPARQASVQAALAWSHALLGADEQLAFRRLAPFRGSFSLDTLRQVVADGEALEGWEAADALDALVDKSLVHIHGDPTAAQPRYRLLEAARQFAAEQLQAAGETATIDARHAAACASLAAAAMQRIWRQGDADWLEAVEPERENLRAALTWAVDVADRPRVAALYDCLTWLALLVAGGNEARWWTPRIERLLEGATLDETALLAFSLAGGQRNIAPQRAIELSRRALAAFGPDGPVAERYRLLCSIALCNARLQRTAEASEVLAQAQALERPDWPARLGLFGADAAGFAAAFSGDTLAAQRHFRRFQALALQAGAEGGSTIVAHNLADIALSLGQVDEAVRQGRDLVARLRRQRNAYQLGFALGNLGAALLQQGDIPAAAAACLEALPMLRQEQHAAWLFDHLALLALRRGRAADALCLLGHGEAGRHASGSPRDPGEQRALQLVLDAAGAVLDAAERTRLQAQGAALDDEAADALARSLG